MASTSKAGTTKSILTPSMTLKGHGDWIKSISYFPDGQRMISGSSDKTTRQWDLKAGKEIEEARDICEKQARAVTVSSNGRWVVTGGGDWILKVCEVETGIVKKLQGHEGSIASIDISVDNTLLASGSEDLTARVWNLETGKLVAGPLESIHWVGAVQFSTDSKKLAVKSDVGRCLEVWDVRSQKLDARIEEHSFGEFPSTPVLWTNKNKNILAAFSFTKDDDAKTIYEFDASTLKTVGTPFEGHTHTVRGLALSFDGALLASASDDDTIKLWAFESRQLLASFDVQSPRVLILSPDSRKLAYTTYTFSPGSPVDATNPGDHRICICDTPPDVLAQARTIARKQRALNDLLTSDATRRPIAGRRRPPISVIPIVQRPPPETVSQQSVFVRLSNLLHFSPRTNALRPSRNDQPRDPLDFSATLPLPLNRPPLPPLPSGRTFSSHVRSSSVKGKQKAHEPKRKPAKTVNVPLGQATYGDAVGVDDGERPYVLFFCLSWFQKKEKKQVPRPVYDDELDDDEEEENVLDPVAVSPPSVQHDKIELTTLTSQSQPEAGPSRPAATNRLEARSS